MPLNNRPTVFLVEDDESISEVITHLVESVGLSIKSFKSPHEFLEAFDIRFRGCLILDVRMPDMNGLDLYEALKKRYSALPVIFMTAYPEIPLAVRAIKSGAVDFIVKPFNNQVFLDQIQRMFSLSPSSITNMQFQRQLESLTPRERQVLEQIVEGKLNKGIAYKLNITMSTVELHRSNLMKKMQAKNSANLIKNYLVAKNSVSF